MLLDRGVLVRDGNAYRLAGEIETLEVPETLQALIAARLDGLTPDERRIVQQASVLGRTFTLRGLSTVSGLNESELESILGSLVRKEIVSLTADPLSPERGQYGFLQDLVKKVAYDTLSRRERKALHLAAAEYLRSLGDEDEIVEVLAAHYVDAYRAAPDDADAEEIRTRARETLVRAAERAASLAANQEAQHAYERAIELSDDPNEQAELHERAGLMARTGARSGEGAAHYEQAIALFEGAGATHPAARVSARLAEVMWDRGRLEEGLEIMDRSFGLLSQEEPDDDLAALAAQLGRFMFFAGQQELAAQRIETALGIAEALSLPEVFAQALTTKAMLLTSHGRKQEGLALMRFALETALEHDKPSAALRTSYNLADTLAQIDRYDEAIEQVRDGLIQARRIGNRYWEWSFLNQLYPVYAFGEWNEAQEMIDQLPEEHWREARQALGGVASIGVLLSVQRGDLREAARLVEVFEELEASADVQERALYACGKARLLLAEGDSSEALRIAETALAARASLGFTQEYLKELDVTAAEAALALGDMEKLAELVAVIDALPTGSGSHFLRAHSARFRAHLAARNADAEGAHRLFRGAAGLYREIGTPVLPGGRPARALRVARAGGSRRRGRSAPRRGAGDLRAARRRALARTGREGRQRQRGARVTCPSCGHENAEGQKFCGECGSALQAGCPSCGAENPPGQKFCGECGTPLTSTTAASAVAVDKPAAPAAERRLVSVLFADLVGFTTALGEPRRRGRRASCSPATSTRPGRRSSAMAARSRSSSATR